MAKKQDERVVPLSCPLTPVQHFQLKEIAKFHHRSMSDELINLIEEVARNILLDMDWNDSELKKYIEKAAINLGITEAEYIEKEKRSYIKRREIEPDVHYYDGPDITWEEVIRYQHTYIVLRSDKEIQEGFVKIGQSVQKYWKDPFPLKVENALGKKEA